MNHSTDDELISAYVDGELSGNELLRASACSKSAPSAGSWSTS